MQLGDVNACKHRISPAGRDTSPQAIREHQTTLSTRMTRHVYALVTLQRFGHAGTAV